MRLENRNRELLPMEERVRQDTLTGKIHDALAEGPQTNADLSSIALDYTRNIRALRKKGVRVDCEKLDGGLFLYWLNEEHEPLSEVDVLVTLPDGTQSIQTIEVRGTNRGVIKNRAQHLAVSGKKILEIRGHINWSAGEDE
jgi:hypothetical protein